MAYGQTARWIARGRATAGGSHISQAGRRAIARGEPLRGSMFHEITGVATIVSAMPERWIRELQDLANDLVNALERIAAALERIAGEEEDTEE